MDVQMPVLNGYEATKLIRRIPALAELPIVALTAGAFLDQQERASQAGMTSFISKPFDVDAAIALIVKLTRHPAVTPAPQEPVVPEWAAENSLGAREVQEVQEVQEDLPGISLKKALATWRDITVFKKFLRRFVHEYADVALHLRSLNPQEAMALAHKLKGASAAVALEDVAAQASALEILLKNHQHPEPGITALQEAMDTVIHTAQHFAPE
jgi:CheY-like chemotaxis protein